MNNHDLNDLDSYRDNVKAWLAEHAPKFSGEVRRGLSLAEDVELGRKWQSLKAKHGFGAITLPIEYGGSGGSELEKIVFSEEEQHYSLPLAYFSISLSNPVPIMLRYAPEQFKKELIPPAIEGRHIWCQMFSEPSAGSDLAALRLKAEKKDGGWLLNGQKLWTSWAQISEWGMVIARTDSGVPKHSGLTCFFLNMRTSGLTVNPIRRLAGHPDLNEVFFDDVFVPNDQRLGEVNGGFKVAIETLMIERHGITDETCSSPSLETLVGLANSSHFNGRPAIKDGELRSSIANAFVSRQGLRSIYRRAMEALSEGRTPGPESAIRKL